MRSSTSCWANHVAVKLFSAGRRRELKAASSSGVGSGGGASSKMSIISL